MKEVRVLDLDAPRVPEGLQPRWGVEYGCGWSGCTACYEPATPDKVMVVRAIEEKVGR